MKQSSIYVDPAELKAKNKNPHQPHGGGVQPVAQIRQPLQQQPKPTQQKVELTKDDLKEITKEAFQEGLKAAQQQTQTEQGQQPAQQAQPQDEASAKSKHKEEKAGSPNKPEGTKETQEKFDKIVERNNYVLFQAQALFPLDFFPDKIIIDMTKVTIIAKSFFATEHVTAIPLKSISDIFMQTSLFTASLTVMYLPHSDRPSAIQPEEAKILALSRKDAIIAKDIIRGMVIAHEDNIDLTNIKLEDLRSKLQELGSTKTDV
jgi:hypothetical protein